MTAEKYERGKVILSQQMQSLDKETPLTLRPRDGITKNVKFTKRILKFVSAVSPVGVILRLTCC